MIRPIFEPGMKVVAKKYKNSLSRLKKDKTYTVRFMDQIGDNWYVYLREVDGSFHSDRFKIPATKRHMFYIKLSGHYGRASGYVKVTKMHEDFMLDKFKIERAAKRATLFLSKGDALTWLVANVTPKKGFELVEVTNKVSL